jgi:hypothetical protein
MAVVVLGLAGAIALRLSGVGGGGQAAGAEAPRSARRMVVLFESEPRGATVTSGERQLGTTPFDDVLELGRHELVFAADGFAAKTLEVEVTRAQQVIRAVLEPESGGPTPPVPAGDAFAAVDAVVSPARESDAGVASGPATPLAPEPRSVLTKGKGKLTLKTRPEATVYHQGRRWADTPIKELSVPAGKLVLKLVRHDTKEEVFLEVEVRANKLTTKQFVFPERSKDGASR